MAAISGSMVSVILNATTPTGASGIPGSYAALSSSAMKLRLNSGTSTSTSAGTEITGSGYTAGGSAFTAAITASSAGAGVSCPAASQTMTWTNNSASPWTIASLDITDGAGVPQRVWFGLFNSQPITVGTGNTFQIAPAGVTIALT